MQEVRAAIYARYSSDKQSEQSIEWQIKECEDYAKRKGFEVSKTYTDYAKSAYKDIEKRTSFMKMMSDARKKAFDILLVYKFDRFSRNRYESVMFKGELKKYNITVISVTESIDGMDAESTPYEAMLEWAAQYYSKQTSERAIRGMRETAIKGLCTGGNIPLGFCIGADKRLQIDEKNAETVREAFRLYSSGMRKTEVAKALNERGMRTKNGNLFTCTNLGPLFDNPMYYGDYTYKGEIERSCPAIVPRDLWEICHNKHEANKRIRGRKSTATDFLLTGKLFCGHCGAPMIGDGGTGRNDTVYHYYSCRARKKEHSCKKKTEKQEMLERYVTEQTLLFLNETGRMESIAENIVKLCEEDRKDDGMKKLQLRILEIEKEVRETVDSLRYIKAEMAIKIINDRLEELEDEKNYCEREIESHKIQKSLILTKKEVLEWLNTFAKGSVDDKNFQKQMIDTFINSIYLFDDKIMIYYNVKSSAQVTYNKAKKDLEQSVSTQKEQGEPKNPSLRTWIFLSKPQAWYIIAVGRILSRAVIPPLYLTTRSVHSSFAADDIRAYP